MRSWAKWFEHRARMDRAEKQAWKAFVLSEWKKPHSERQNGIR